MDSSTVGDIIPAFWDIGVVALRALAKHMGLSVDSSASLFSVLCVLVTHILGLDDADVLTILSLRLSPSSKDYLEDLACSEDVADMLDKSDQSELEKGKEAEGQ